MAKLTEHNVEINGVLHTMLLDSEDVERYKKAGLIKPKPAAPKSDEKQTAPANKQTAPAANK